jgi:hypothetical protein
MKQSKAYAAIAHLLHVVMAFYALTLAYFLIRGAFDFTLWGARFYLRDSVRPYQIFMAAAMMRAALYVFSGSGLLAAIRARLLAALAALTGHKEAAAITLIVAWAMGLRFWSLAQGAQDEVFYDDALDFMRTVWQYLNWAYLYDTGYPEFSSHLTEWGVRLLVGSAGFLGFNPIEINRTLINLCAVTLNLVYTLGIFLTVYGVAAIIGRRDAGILALFLIGVSITELQTAHYYINDVPMSFLAMLGVYCAALNLKEERTWPYILSGAFLALAFASKFNGLLSFIYVGLIYLRLHPSPREFIGSLDKMLKLALVFVAVYVMVNPMILLDPGAKLDNTIQQIYFMTRPRGQGAFSPVDNTMLNHIKLLFTQWSYHLWAIRGLFDPVPLAVGIISLAFVAYRHGWRLAFLWLSPVLFALLGRMTKPNSAPLHYLNLIPLLLLAASVGILDLLKMIPSRLARGALLSTLIVWGAYQALQDTSYWSLPPTFKVQHDWLEENLDYYADVWAPKDLMPLAAGDPRKIREVYTGPEKWCYALHRDARHYIILKNGLPVLFPKAQFPSQRKTSTIFTASRDLAVTERMFATGPEPRLYEVTRYVMAGEAVADRIAVMVKNAALKENPVTLRIGRSLFTKKLKPGEKALFSAPMNENRTFLFEGRYVKVFANSEEDAVWMVAATHEDIGDLLLENGNKAGALADYARSGTAYSLLRIMALADDPAQKPMAAATLKNKYPDLFQTITTVAPGQWTFQNLAGWDDNLFLSKMTRRYGYEDFHKQEIPPAGFTLGPQSNLWGPYQPIMRGEYRLDIKWLVAGKGPESFQMNYGTRRIPGASIVRTLPGAEAVAGRTSINITEENMVDFPFEVWIGKVSGGDLGVAEIALTIDYVGPMKKLVREALDGVGMEAMKGL